MRVCQPVHMVGGGSHVTITNDALDWNVQHPPPPPPANMGPQDPPEYGTSGPPLLVTSGGYHRRPVQTCSLQDTPPPVLVSSGEVRPTGI